MSTEGKRCREPFVLSTEEAIKQLFQVEEYAKKEVEGGSFDSSFLVTPEWILRIAEIVRSMEESDGKQA